MYVWLKQFTPRTGHLAQVAARAALNSPSAQTLHLSAPLQTPPLARHERLKSPAAQGSHAPCTLSGASPSAQARHEVRSKELTRPGGQALHSTARAPLALPAAHGSQRTLELAAGWHSKWRWWWVSAHSAEQVQLWRH